MTSDRVAFATAPDEAGRKDRGRLRGHDKGMKPAPLPRYFARRSHFPNDRSIDAQISSPVRREIPTHQNRFAVLAEEPVAQEQETKGDRPSYRSPTRRPQRKRRPNRRRRKGHRAAKLERDEQTVSMGKATEEVSDQAEENHWIEQDRRLDRARKMVASMSTQQTAGSTNNMLSGCQALVGEVMMLMYLDTGCAMEGVMDRKCLKAMAAAGAKFTGATLTTKATSASGHVIEFEEAVQTNVVVDTRDGQRQAVLTFAIMKADFALGALIGSPGLAKLHKEVECWDPRTQVIPRENGNMPRAHVLKTEALVRTASHATVPPNCAKAVFVIGPIRQTAVGSDAIAEPGYGRWAGFTGRTLTTIRRDQCSRVGAFVLVTNPSPYKSIIIPRGSPIARLDINWRRVRAETITPDKEPARLREKYTGPVPPLPLTAFIPGQPEPAEPKPEEEIPAWMESTLKEVAAKENLDREALHTVAKEIRTAMSETAKDLGPERTGRLTKTLLKHAGVFTPISFDKVGASDELEPMTIPLIQGARVQSFPPRRLGYARRKMLADLVRKMLEDKVIQPSKSPWAFPVVLAPKSNGEIRFCVDYRRLNEITRRDSYPLPRMDDLLDRLGEARFRSTADLTSGFWQVAMSPRDKEKTAFITPDGLYQFNTMPFGLCNAPGHFARQMAKVLAGMNFFFTCVYLDDIIIFSKTFEEHIDHLDRVLTRLAEVNLKVKLKKCSFCKKEIKFLGHVVSDSGVSVDPEKTSAVLEARAPTNKKELRSILGLLNYYRKFIEGYATIAAPLSRLTGTKTAWEWGLVEQQAFDRLKGCLAQAPVLAFPHPTRPIRLRTDASGYAIAGVLQQQQEDGEWHPIAYWSRAMRQSERSYAATEREGLAAVSMLKHFRPYLEGRSFDLLSDAQALKWIVNNDSHNSRLARWAIILKTKGAHLCYRPGADMADADALSRLPMASSDVREPEGIEDDLELYSQEVSRQLKEEWDLEKEEHTVLANIVHEVLENGEQTRPPVELKEIKEAQAKDDLVQRITKRLKNPQEKPKGKTDIDTYIHKCTVTEGFLCHTDQNPQTGEEYDRLWIPESGDLRERVLAYVHGSITTCHAGRGKTKERLKTKYYWPGMLQEADRFIRQCHTCQIRKARASDPGQIKCITSDNPMDLVSIDLVGPLQRTDRRNAYILSWIDHFTRVGDAVALTSKKAEEVGRGILELISRHGAPRRILSDRGGEFCSIWTRTLFKDLRLRGINTSGYAPQTNGKAERYHRSLIGLLSTLVSEEEDDWDVQLPLAVFAYNTQVHSATGRTPFFLDHLREARHPWEQTVEDQSLKELPKTPSGWGTDMMRKAAKVYDQVRRRLDAQKEEIERQAEGARAMLEQLQPGDQVLLKIPKSVTTKFGPKFQGPATIVRVKTDGINYVLEWPSGKQTLAHIRRLAKYHGQLPAEEEVPKEVQEPYDSPRVVVPGTSHKNGEELESKDEETTEWEVQRIEKRRYHKLDGLQVLVNWKGLSKEHWSWEPEEELMRNCSKLISEFTERDRKRRRKERRSKRNAGRRAQLGRRSSRGKK